MCRPVAGEDLAGGAGHAAGEQQGWSGRGEGHAWMGEAAPGRQVETGGQQLNPGGREGLFSAAARYLPSWGLQQHSAGQAKG